MFGLSRHKKVIPIFQGLIGAARLYEEYTGDTIPRDSSPGLLAQKLKETFPEVEDWGSMPAAYVLPTLEHVIEARGN